MRDRLIELIDQKQVYGIDQYQPESHNTYLLDNDELADHLIENGVIVPPVKVGQTVYVPWQWGGQEGIASTIVECIQIVRDAELRGFFIDMKSDDTAFNDVYGFWRTFDDIGKKIFLTREEAEKALAERGYKK